MVLKKACLIAGTLGMASCAHSAKIVNEIGDNFEVRYDPLLSTPQEADEAANQKCENGAKFIGTRSRWDTIKFRQYRCVE